MTKKSTHKTDYENNPLFIVTKGITLLLNLARNITAVLLAISVLTFISGSGSWTYPTNNEMESFVATLSGWSMDQWLFASAAACIFALAFIMISSLLGGVSSYTSAEIAKGKQVALSDAFHTAFEHLWSYVWLQIILFVKLLLWTLLFIVPGIYFSFRYSLAGVAFYDSKKNLRGDAAIQESLRLTKNGWITTFTSNILFNLLTLGVLKSIVTTGVNAMLYKQFESVGDKKPPAHWISWYVLIFASIALATSLIFLIIDIATNNVASL